jgi:AmiR/NasT family two-component response regulator
MVEIVDAWTDESVTREQLADAQRRIENLETALRTSRQIGIAMGILMCRNGCTEDDAFAALRKASQRRQRKLRDIAEEVALTGHLPD